MFDKQINWLASWRSFDEFKFEYEVNIVFIPALRIRTEHFMERHNDPLDIGKSIIGVAYFEQPEAWGNFNPKVIDEEGTIKVIIRIRDVNVKLYHFKTKLKPKTLDEAKNKFDFW